MSRLGRQSFRFDAPPKIAARTSVVGPKEGQGPLGGEFDMILEDDLLGMKSWELAEGEMARRAAEETLRRANIAPKDVQMLLAGDLNNQIIASSFAARALGVPFVGLYGACSTFVEALSIGGALVSAGYAANALCCASSHFCTAERQFRFPLELGNQRPPQASWTATACGCALLLPDAAENDLRVTHATIGRVIDLGIRDANHMGAAMAPAVFDCLASHFADTGRTPMDYDVIVTGDLGRIGRGLLLELLLAAGIEVPENKLIDCGAMLYSDAQDPHAGGSGCGCVASVTCGWLLRRLETGEFRRALAAGSGAMLSPTSTLQGETVPGISYAVSIEGGASWK